MSGCSLCPRRCRTRPGGFCGAGDVTRVFRWGPHFGEEPPICGPQGSGAVFFSRCTMKCIYCQNSPWSWQGGGEDISTEKLTGVFRQLAVEDRCCNWNLVSPTPYLPFIREALAPLLSEGVKLPIVWNSSGYESAETLKRYRDLCDIALVDLRYASDATAAKASAAPGYVATSRAAVKWLWDNLGQIDSEEPGAATRGVIVRVLVLPGHAVEAVENLAWLAAECSNEVHISVMSQYTPVFRAKDIPPFNRAVTEEEYDTVASAASDFGFTHGWLQGFESQSADLDLLGESMPSGHGAVGV